MGVANLLGGIAVLILGALTTLFAGQLSYGSEFGPGPGFLPLWIGIGLVAFGIVTVIQGFRTRGREQERFFLPNTRRVVVVLASLAVTFLLVPVLGLSASLALFTAFTMRTAGRHTWVQCAVVAVVTGFAIQGIFGYLLDIPLPKGYLGF